MKVSRRSTVAETRDRIIDQALCLVHAQGFYRTTLAQFAKAAEVPLGNFYYYFKTKESLGEAMIDRRVSEYRSFIAEWEKDPSPKKRLLNLVGTRRMLKDELVQYGCHIGSLTQELAKKGGPLAEKAGALFDLFLDWIAEQFKALGYEKEAQALALQLMSSLQGVTVIANALRRSDLLLEEIDRLSQGIRELPTPSGQLEKARPL